MHAAALVPLAFLTVSAAAKAQCEPRWAAGFGSFAPPGIVTAVGTFRDELVFATRNATSTHVTVQRWDGRTITAAGTAISNPFIVEAYVDVLLEHDFGQGPRLLAMGQFLTVGGVPARGAAQWDGAAWSAMPGLGVWDDHVLDACVFDDGSGPSVHAVGRLEFQSGQRGIARYVSGAWQEFGNDPALWAICVAEYDDGSGPALYVGGGTTAFASSGVLRWTGSAWVSVGPATGSSTPRDLVVHDDGSGPALYAGGSFTAIGGITAYHVARWDGTTWAPVGAGIGQDVVSLVSVGSGPSARLHAFGQPANAPGTLSAAAATWNGSTWSALDTGGNYTVEHATSWDDGTGPTVCATAYLSETEPDILRWREGVLDPLEEGQGIGGRVTAFEVFDVDGTPRLHVAGRFSAAGDRPARSVARWNGASWEALGSGLSFSTNPNEAEVFALETFDDGQGPKLYAGGEFSSPGFGVARWDGTSWQAVPGLVGNGAYGGDRRVRALCVHDDGSGPALYAGGVFLVPGSTITYNIARWDGTSWTGLANGIPEDSWGVSVNALASWDDGGGQALYAAGRFIQGIPQVPRTQNFARWRGGTWAPACATGDWGPNYDVLALRVLDDGTGERLWLAGGFTTLGGVPAARVGTCDGQEYRAVGAGFANAAFEVRAVELHDAGAVHAPEIYVAGVLGTMASGIPYRGVARWDGSAWVQVDTGVHGPGSGGRALRSFDAGNGPALWLGGTFESAAILMPSKNVARLDATCADPRLFCFGDGSAAPCPCANASAVGAQAGCASSLGIGGTLRASGSPSLSADTIVLAGGSMPNSSVLYFQGAQVTNGGAGVAFGDGLKCTNGPFVRLRTATNVGGASQYPTAGDPTVSTKGLVTEPGTRHYQARYRNAVAFCTSETFNYTNGVTIAWAP
ncbi:MAG: hypothetical protein JNK02_00195 [Planctomycetes bacterium]|nr:hypothetical protein [Planctomycetota bacterium]